MSEKERDLRDLLVDVRAADGPDPKLDVRLLFVRAPVGLELAMSTSPPPYTGSFDEAIRYWGLVFPGVMPPECDTPLEIIDKMLCRLIDEKPNNAAEPQVQEGE